MAFGDQWNSKKYPDGCRSCGQTKSKHVGLGLCHNCYRDTEINEAARNGTLENVFAERATTTTSTDRSEGVATDDFDSVAFVGDDREIDDEAVTFTSPGERRPGSSTNAPVGEPVSDVSPGSKFGSGFFKRKPKAQPTYTAPTREKAPKVAGRRSSTSGTIEDIWAGVGGVAQRAGYVPLGRYMAWQAPAAGELLDQALAGTAVDRKFLQPAVKARGRLDIVGAIMGPPAIIVAIQRNPARAELLIPALRSAIRGSLPTLLPAMKKAQAREEKVNQAIRDYLPDGMEIPDGVDPVDIVIGQLFDGWVPPEPEPNMGDVTNVQDVDTNATFN